MKEFKGIELTDDKPKAITLVGSSRFCGHMAVMAWEFDMGMHRDCVWNCGGTECPAPTGNYYVDRKAEAVRKIKQQPYY